MLGVIDEKRGVDEMRRISSANQNATRSGDVGDVVVLTKLPQKLLRQCRRSRRKQPQMEEFVSLRIDGVDETQSVSFANPKPMGFW
ncbi:hypothetical protein GCM10009066_24700 [Halarchaeum salinum]|uniref:Uncharacterized protein n=1 Tax=Halarchaeum salinum TaxID=489912 RepID=A0AAV3SB94_9EURY